MRKFLILILMLFTMLSLTSCGETPRIQIKEVTAIKNYDTYILIFDADVPVERYLIEYQYQGETIKEYIATDYYKVKLLTDRQRTYTFLITAIGDNKDTLTSITYTFKLDAEKYQVPGINLEVMEKNGLYSIYFNEDKKIPYSLVFKVNKEKAFVFEDVHTGYNFTLEEIKKVLQISETLTNEIEIEIFVQSSGNSDYFRNTESNIEFLCKF